MNLYTYLILSIICVTPLLADCPDSCLCAKYRLLSSVVLHVYCGPDLKRVPRDHVGSDVTTLDLSSNRITVLTNADEQVKNMTQLKVLILAKNHMTKVEANSLRGFTSLVQLDLSVNKISNIPNELFQTMPSLKRLHLSYNANITLPANGFGTKELETLHIDNCNLTQIPLKFFDTMPNIKHLHLEGNQISRLESNLITSFQTMTFVNLENNNISVFVPEITALLEKYDVVIGLNGNPFPCDCQFSAGYDIYTTSHIMSDSDSWFTESRHSLRCALPGGRNTTEQDEFLKNLNCDFATYNIETIVETTTTDLSINMTDYNITSTNSSNESSEWDYEEYMKEKYDMNTWFTSHTVLWSFLGIVVFIVLLVAIAMVVKRHTGPPRLSERRHQFGLLQSEIEDGDEH